MDDRSGRRESAVADLLDAIVDGDLPAYVERPVDSHDPVWDRTLHALGLALGLRWSEALDVARSVNPASEDRDATWLHTAVLAWAAAGDDGPDADTWLPSTCGPALGDLADPETQTSLGQFCGYLLVEAALAHARLDLADAFVACLEPGLWRPLVLSGAPHRFSRMLELCRMRVLAFRGDIAAADEVRRGLDDATHGRLTALTAATVCLVRGNDADVGDVHRLASLVDELVPDAADLVGAGSHMLTAFGLLAVGEVGEAARRVLLAGGDPSLGALNVIDRALGLEMLVALAVAADDLDAAEAWRDRAAPLLLSPIADSTVARVHSRVALLAGRPDEAVAWAERAIARAHETDRMIEEAEGEIVLSRARLHQHGAGDRSTAVQALQATVALAEARGHHSVRRSAARELRPIGLRLRPMAGSGWVGLTAREGEIARLVADGSTNREIATRLYISEHTVRAHVSRVLAAFGIATRSGLPGALAEGEPSSEHAAQCVVPPLTTRQEQVAVLVGQGLGNAAIAGELGVSVRTVEKHVGDIMVRWDLSGRTAIARVVAHRLPGVSMPADTQEP